MKTEKSFVAGDAYPELDKNVLRIYNMRFCPFGQRTRMVIAHKNIPCETVNVHLVQKPDWFLARNPLGKVPTLEFNDKVVYDSSVCDDYLDEIYPENKLHPEDPYVRARHKMLMEHFGAVIGAYYGAARADDDKRKEFKEKVQVELDRFEEELKDKKFFGGDKLSMLDVHIWPWFERMPLSMKTMNLEYLPTDRFPRIHKWMKAMYETQAVKKTAFDEKSHLAFFDSYKAGKPNYDFGLE